MAARRKLSEPFPLPDEDGIKRRPGETADSTAPRGRQGITPDEFAQLQRDFGKEATREALSGFLTKDSGGGRKVSKNEALLLFGDTVGKPGNFFRSGEVPTFDELRESTAIVQGRLQGVNDLSNKEARVTATAALRPRPEQTLDTARRRLATQRLRAGRFELQPNPGGQGATQDLFAPAHLARTRLSGGFG